jgi:hypothetical protein
MPPTRLKVIPAGCTRSGPCMVPTLTGTSPCSVQGYSRQVASCMLHALVNIMPTLFNDQVGSSCQVARAAWASPGMGSTPGVGPQTMPYPKYLRIVLPSKALKSPQRPSGPADTPPPSPPPKTPNPTFYIGSPVPLVQRLRVTCKYHAHPVGPRWQVVTGAALGVTWCGQNLELQGADADVIPC